MKTLNVRLVIILLACVPILGGAVWGIHQLQVRRTAGIYLTQAAAAAERAEQAKTQGDSQTEVQERLEQVDQLRRYVNAKPDDTAVAQQLGLLEADLALDKRCLQAEPRLFGWAVRDLENLLRQDPRRNLARRKLVETYLVAGQFSDAKDHLDSLLQESPNDGELLQLLGRCQVGLDKNDDALASLQAALKNAPEQIDVYRLMMALLTDRNRLNRPAEADAQVKRMLESLADSAQAQLIYGGYVGSMARFRSLNELRKHPLLLEAIVPAVLAEAVDKALKDLPSAAEDADARLLAGKRAVLADAVERAVKAYAKELPLDDPDALLLATIRGVQADTSDSAAMAKTEQEVLKALQPELAPDDYQALSLASKKGVLLAAMKNALETLNSHKPLEIAIHRVLDDAQEHALRARELAAQDHQALAAAEKHGLLVQAMKLALQKDDTWTLRLTANRPLLVNALQEAIKALNLPADDPDARLLAERQAILLEVLKRALAARELASSDRQALLQDEPGSLLSKAVQQAVESTRSDLETNDTGAILLSTECARMRGETDTARERLKQGIEAHPQDVNVYLALAELELQSGRPDEAIACLEQGLKATNNDVKLLWRMTLLLLNENWLEEAKQSYRKLEEANYTPALLGYLRGRLEFAEGHWLAASQELEKARTRLTGEPTYLKETELYLGKCYEQLGKSAEAVAAYRRALAVDPNYAQARSGVLESSLRRIRAALRAGQVADAEKMFQDTETEFRQMVGRVSNPAGGWLALAQLRTQMNLATELSKRNWAAVESLVDEAAAANPESPDVVIMRANLLALQAADLAKLATEEKSPQQREQMSARARDMVQRAERMLVEARKQNPQEARFWFALIDLAENQQQWDQAEALLEAVQKALGDSLLLRLTRARYFMRRYQKEGVGRLPELANNLAELPEKDRLLLLTSLAQLAQSQEGWQQAEEFFDKAQQELGDSVGLRLARATYLARRNEKDAPEQLKKLADKADQFPLADRRQLWRGLLSVAMQMQDDEQAAFFCRQLAEVEPNNLYALTLLMEFAVRLGDDSGIEEVLNKIEAIEGKGPYWLAGQAVRLRFLAKGPDDKRLDQALDYLNQAAEARPGWSRVLLLKAIIYDQKGDGAAALKLYQQAFDAGERDPYAIRRAIQLLTAQQRYEEAQGLTSLLAGRQLPPSLTFDRLQRTIARQRGDTDREFELAKSIAAQSDDYHDHIWYGQLLAAKAQRAKEDGQTEEANQTFAEAQKVLQHAVDLSDKEANTWVALVDFLAKTGQMEAAEKAIEQVRQKVPAEKIHSALGPCYACLGQTEKAEQEFQAALAAAPDDPDILALVARFHLGGSDPESARPYLQKIVDAQGQADQGQVMWARREMAKLLIHEGKHASRQQALALIEENLALVPSSPEDQSIKASLLGAEPTRAQREEAIQALKSLKSPRPDQRYHLARLYWELGDWGNAKREMLELLGTPDVNPDYMIVYIQWLLQRNELSDADLWVRKLEGTTAPPLAIREFRAELAFRHKKYEEAIKLVKGFLDDPNAGTASEATRLNWIAQTLERLAWQSHEAGDEEQANRIAVEANTVYEKLARENPRQELRYAAFLAKLGRIDKALDRTVQGWSYAKPEELANVCNIILSGKLASKEQIERTERIVKAALDRFEKPIVLLLVMGQVRATQQRYDEAIGFYRQALGMDEDNVVALNNFAVLCALRGVDLPEALKAIDRAIEVAGPLPELLDSRASVYIASGQPDKALAELKKAIAEKDTPIRYFHQAQAYLAKGQEQQAVSSMKEALTLGLKPEILQPLELPSYEKLKALSQ